MHSPISPNPHTTYASLGSRASPRRWYGLRHSSHLPFASGHPSLGLIIESMMDDLDMIAPMSLPLFIDYFSKELILRLRYQEYCGYMIRHAIFVRH